MMKIAICDDNKAWLERAEGLIRDFAKRSGMDAEVAVCSSPEEISGCFGADAPDVLFMDIEFDNAQGEAPGIEAVKEINSLYPDCQVVYLTNYLNFALDVYQTEHVWFAVKDQFEERLPEIFGRIAQLEDDSRADLIIRETGGARKRLMCGSIRYFERKGRVTAIVTDDGEYTVHERIPEIEAKLPGYFGRCHTSFIVNMAKVSSIGERSLRLEDGTDILISRGYGRPFRLKYMEWAGSRVVR